MTPTRRIVATLLVVLASLLAFVAIFAIWANRQLLNTDNWTDTSTKLLENEDIRDQVAGYLVDQLYTGDVPQAQIEEALPPRAQGLAAPLATGLRDASERALEAILQRPRVQKLWEEANRRAHRRFLQIVEGGTDNVSTEGGDVTLNLREVLGNSGVGGKVASALPADAGQLTILRSDQLSFAQDVVDLLKTLAVVLVALALVLFALGVYLARGWRREALRACGIAFLAAGLGALVARSLAGTVVVNELSSTESVRPAIEAAWEIGTSLLVQAATAAIAYGVVIVLAAWLAGPMPSAVAVRRELAPYLREPSYAYGSVAVLIALILWWGPTPATRQVIPVLILIALLVLGVEVLRRQTAREFPNASLEEARIRRRAMWKRGARPPESA
jgi:hypothetical protein